MLIIKFVVFYKSVSYLIVRTEQLSNPRGCQSFLQSLEKQLIVTTEMNSGINTITYNYIRQQLRNEL